MSVAPYILGIDPGFDRLGFGVITGPFASPRHVAHGCLTTEKSQPFDRRLHQLGEQLAALLKEYRPNVVGIEKLFFANNTKTACAVSEVRGVVIFLAIAHGATIREFTPLQVKQRVAGYGAAGKPQVGIMVKTLLHLPAVPRPDDAADALAIALCAHSASMP